MTDRTRKQARPGEDGAPQESGTSPHTHRPRKRFGQNFLHDRNVIERIVSAIGTAPGDHVVEIGPGQGALTRDLANARPELLSVIEIDRDLAAQLRAEFEGREGFHLYDADALRFDFQALPNPRPLRVVGNLPYNISTPLLFHLLSNRECIRDLHLMLQLEVAQRMVARPGTAAYGRLSVMAQMECDAEILFRVPPGAFHPPPRVYSAVLRMTVRPPPITVIPERAIFARVVQQAFSMRRKTLRNALRGTLDGADIERAGVDPGARAETLGLEEFARLSVIAAASAGRAD